MDPQIDREVLKTSPKRSTYLEPSGGPGSGPRRVVKRFHGPDVLDRIRDRLRARNEYDALNRCQGLGLPVPTALELRRERGRWEVVTEYLEQAMPLDSWLRSRPPQDQQQQVARDLGALVARLMEVGLDHRDLHPGNFLTQGTGTSSPRLWLMDLTKSRLQRQRSAEGMIGDLVQLTAGLRELLSDGCRRRCLVEYLRRLPDGLRAALPERPALGERIEDEARVYRRRDIRRRTRRWLRDSSSVEPFDDERGVGFVSRAAPPELPLLTQRARNAGDGSGRLQLDVGTLWVVAGEPWARLLERWRQQVRLFTHGIPCLPPLCLSRTPGPWLGLDAGGDVAPLGRLLEGTAELDPLLREAVIESYGSLLGTLHDRQLHMPRLELDAIWSTPDGNLRFGPAPEIVDLPFRSALGLTHGHRRVLQAWSGPWSEQDERVCAQAYARALRHSSAERHLVLAGGPR